MCVYMLKPVYVVIPAKTADGELPVCYLRENYISHHRVGCELRDFSKRPLSS